MNKRKNKGRRIIYQVLDEAKKILGTFQSMRSARKFIKYPCKPLHYDKKLSNAKFFIKMVTQTKTILYNFVLDAVREIKRTKSNKSKKEGGGVNICYHLQKN